MSQWKWEEWYLWKFEFGIWKPEVGVCVIGGEGGVVFVWIWNSILKFKTWSRRMCHRRGPMKGRCHHRRRTTLSPKLPPQVNQEESLAGNKSWLILDLLLVFPFATYWGLSTQTLVGQFSTIHSVCIMLIAHLWRLANVQLFSPIEKKLLFRVFTFIWKDKKVKWISFLATLVALHFTHVSEWVSEW